ncbi:MAG: ATP-binding protein [Pyrinomonadaceae bacterium]
MTDEQHPLFELQTEPNPDAELINDAQAELILNVGEGSFSEVKAIQISPGRLSQTISAFANTDGGELYVGIAERQLGGNVKKRDWAGFVNIEAANGHLQAFEKVLPLGKDFQYEFLQCLSKPGLVLHVQVNRTPEIVKATDGIAYLRRGAQSLPQKTSEEIKRLEYAKGVTSFETHPVQASPDVIIDSPVTRDFMEYVVPQADPEAWLRKQSLIVGDKPTVAGLLLFSEEPQAQLPKRCGVKIYRYETREAEGFRDVLTFIPVTIEGDIYDQIRKAVKKTIEITEGIQYLNPERGLENIKYPPEALHEIIANAVIHRDYSIADDIHIRIFDNRIEVQSPGRLPAHVNTSNLYDERFARNGAIVRLLNKFPDPPNRDVGEGLNTARDKMREMGLKDPDYEERDSDLRVIIRHETLASPEMMIMKYLETNETIKNKEARELTYIRDTDRMKRILSSMKAAGEIESAGKGYGGTRYRKKIKEATPEKISDENDLF